MKTQTIIVLLTLTLAACAPGTSTPTETPHSSATSTPLPPTSTATLEVTPTFVPATPIPTLEPPLILTPDAIQVERWQEYQTELIKVVLSGYDDPTLYKHSLCEWDILGRSGQEVYVWAYCATGGGGSGSHPAVIHLNVDGTIQNVEAALYGYSRDSVIQELFPADVRDKIYMYYFPSVPYTGRPEVLRKHLHYRREHPEELPLVVLLATPSP